MSHRASNSDDWSNYLSARLSLLSDEVKKTVGTGIENVAEQTQSLREDVNSKISQYKVWVDSKISTPSPSGNINQTVQQLSAEKKQLERLLQVQSDLFEKKLKSLTAHIDRHENVNYAQKEEIRHLRKELDKRNSLFNKMQKSLKKYKGKIEESDIVEALRKMDDDGLSKMISSIALIQQERREAKLRHKECAICFSEKKCCAFVPCGHLCVCSSCADLIVQETSPTCPICREPVESHFRVYD